MFKRSYRVTQPRRRASLADDPVKREEDAMPEVYVYAVEGRSIEQKRSLVKDITDAVVKHFKVTPDAVMVQIMEAAKDTKAKGGVLFSDRPPA